MLLQHHKWYMGQGSVHWVTFVLAVIGLIDLCIHCTAVFITLRNNVRQVTVLENMSPHKLDKCNIIKNIYI